MAFYPYSDILRDQYKRPVPGALVVVQDAVSEQYVDLFDLSGTPISNPTTTQLDGSFSFQVDAGSQYLVSYRYGGREVYSERLDLGPYISEAVSDALDTKANFSDLAATSAALQNNINIETNERTAATRFTRTDPFTYRLGYDYANNQASAVKIGGNRAFTGTEGVLQIGGNGPKDGPATTGGNGSYLAPLGHPDWPTMQPSIARNALELALYGNGTTGLGTSTGTTTFSATSGAFTVADAGRTIWIEGMARTVAAYVSATQVTLSASVPAGTNLVWHIAITSGSGTGSLSGSTFTRTVGDPFIPHYFGTGFKLLLNGVPYTVTATAGDTYTLATPPAAGNYSYAYETVINDQIATFRVGPQFPGSDEENLSIIARTMRYEIRPTYAGNGKYRDLVLGSGEYTPGSLAEQIVVSADGRLALGGPTARPTLLIDHSTASSVNYMQMVSAPTGFGPSFRARGTDANIALNYDTKGTGEHNFTVGSFAALALRIYGVTGPDYLAIAADNGAPYIASAGGSANSDIRLLPKGTGLVRFGALTANADAPITGYISVKDAGGVIRKLAVIA